MKKTVFLAIAIAFTLFTDFKLIPGPKANAIVDQQEGVYLFLFCKPSSEYDYLGSIKVKAAWTGQTTEMVNGMLKKLKKDYPQADGLIFTTADLDKADAVKFK